MNIGFDLVENLKGKAKEGQRREKREVKTQPSLRVFHYFIISLYKH